MHISVKDAAERLNISSRAIQARCKKEGLKKQGKTYLIPEDILKKWEGTTTVKAKRNEAETKRNEALREGDEDEAESIIEEFTPEQYEKLQEVIHHYPELMERIEDYKNEIQYLRKSLDKKADQMDKLIGTINDSIKSIHQQNFLKAKENGYDTE